jgi:hypothetical protein
VSFDAKFEVRNREIEELLRKIGNRIGDDMPTGYGFALLLFGFGDAGELFYISNAERPDICNVMREFIAKHDHN